MMDIFRRPGEPGAGYVPLGPAATYKVATTDFQGLMASGYKDIFGPASGL